MNTYMESTPTHNLWFWPKRLPLAFSVAETSVAKMSGAETSVAETSVAEMSYIPKKYPQNLHTPKNIQFSENPKKY